MSTFEELCGAVAAVRSAFRVQLKVGFPRGGRRVGSDE